MLKMPEKIFKRELTKKELIVVISAAVAVFALAYYVLLCNPLINELKIARAGCSTVEAETIRVRAALATLGTEDVKKVTVAEEDVAIAIHELTVTGKLKGIDFVSITPGRTEKQGHSHEVLPLEIEAESTCRALGEFFGLLDELKDGLVTLRSFDIVADAKDPGKLKAKFVVNLHLSGE